MTKEEYKEYLKRHLKLVDDFLETSNLGISDTLLLVHLRLDTAERLYRLENSKTYE